MPPTDLVPCFYDGQNYHRDSPAEFRSRAEVRECKRQKLGEFRVNGTVFLFFQRVAKKVAQACDGLIGAGNLLPFSKPRSTGDKLHYPIPMAGDGTAYLRSIRKLIHVSSRNLFARQAIA